MWIVCLIQHYLLSCPSSSTQVDIAAFISRQSVTLAQLLFLSHCSLTEKPQTVCHFLTRQLLMAKRIVNWQQGNNNMRQNKIQIQKTSQGNMRSQEGLVSCDTFVIVGKEGVSETKTKIKYKSNQIKIKSIDSIAVTLLVDILLSLTNNNLMGGI